MKIKKSELYFYELLRDFLHKYLIIQRKFTEATVKNYTDSLDQYRQYLRSQKEIRLIKLGFTALQKKWFMTFCIWLRDSESKSINTINLPAFSNQVISTLNILRWRSHPISWNRATGSVIESQSSDGGSHDLCRGSQLDDLVFDHPFPLPHGTSPSIRMV